MRLKQLEMDALALAEQGDIDGSIAEFSKAIQLCPTYASAYNNRGQAFRLKGLSEQALTDVCKAIELGSGSPSTLMQAYTQRAVLYRQMGKTKEAELDFQKGAQYGNPLAKAVVKNNPFAKLFIFLT